MKDEHESELSLDMQMTWAAFHASQVESYEDFPLDTSSLLPLFQEESKSAAMIRHSMDVVIETVKLAHCSNHGLTERLDPSYLLHLLFGVEWWYYCMHPSQIA